MGSWFSRLFGPAQNVIDGPGTRIQNIAINNFRGILGVLVPLFVLVPLCVMTWLSEEKPYYMTVLCMWLWMFWFFLIQPISIPCTAMIPIFLLPMAGVMPTMATTKCYFNEGVCLFILTSMLILLWNNCGFDRRIALCFLTSGDACQFSGKRLVFKCSTAAYILSMFSNRLIVTSTLTQYVTPILTNMQSSYGKSASEPNFDEIRYIVNLAIETSSSIGSIAILHSAYGTLLFRAVWLDFPPEGLEYPEVFNYLQYFLYAFPVSFVMYLFNISYHMLLINWFAGKAMTAASMGELRKNILQLKSSVPKKSSCHEKLAVLFSFVALLFIFFRWSTYEFLGWARFNLVKPHPMTVPLIKDSCIVALFVIALHMLPKSFNFYQFMDVDKKSELKNLKPESAILWWRFVDKNTNYGYFFVFGAAIALNKAIQGSGLNVYLEEIFRKDFSSNPSWCLELFLICLGICILANVMNGCAALVCYLPFILNIIPLPWQGSLYLAALGVGIGSSLGFMLPFLYTPAYFCHHTGKVPVKKMVLYEFFNVWACCGILWFSLCYWGPFILNPSKSGILPVFAPSTSLLSTTTPADDTTTPTPGPEGGGEPEGDAGAE